MDFRLTPARSMLVATILYLLVGPIAGAKPPRRQNPDPQDLLQKAGALSG